MKTPIADDEKTPPGFAGSGFAIKSFKGKPSLAFYDPEPGSGPAWRMVPIEAALAFLMESLPTSLDGLPVGALWNNAGVLCVALP